MPETSGTTLPKQFGMKVRSRGRGSGDNHARYQSMLIDVAGTVQMDGYGGGIFGWNMYTGKPAVVFQNPVPSEGRLKSKRVNSMNDWINGLNINRNLYRLGQGAVALVQDITTRRDFSSMDVNINGQMVSARVFFCQWTSCWRSADAGAVGQKSIMIGYGSASVSEGGERENGDGTSPDIVNIDFFQPVGPLNAWNSPNEPGGLYPVVFSFNRLADLLLHVDFEASARGHDRFLVRAIENASGMIVGEGENISAYRFNPENSFAETFARNMAVRLHLTRAGLAQFVEAPGYTIQVIGMRRYPCSFQENERGKSLSQQMMANQVFLPRDESGNLAALVAVPMAMRGAMDQNGGVWLDKAQAIGHTGYQGNGGFSENSEIIAADAYSGCPVPDAEGENKERGLDRKVVEFRLQGQNGEAVVEMADSMRSLARLLGCRTIAWPDGRVNLDYFNQVWNDVNEPFPISEPGRAAIQPVQAAPQQPAPQPAAQQPQYAAPQPAPAQPQYAAPQQPAPQPQPQYGGQPQYAAPQPAPRQPQYAAPQQPAPQPAAPQQPAPQQPAPQPAAPQQPAPQQPQYAPPSPNAAQPQRPAAPQPQYGGQQQPAYAPQFTRPGNYGAHYGSAAPREQAPPPPAPEPANPVYPSEGGLTDEVPF